jgi:DNA repair photolyase
MRGSLGARYDVAMTQAAYREIDAKSITRVAGTTDPWFLGRYRMNLYRGCEHGCLYCDGRAERYYVGGQFDREITVKRNAVRVLDAELARVREPGFVFLGGGVSDAYQPAEARFRLARGVLELALKHHLPVHVLTKSAIVERDLDLLEQINSATRAILSFSVQTVDEAVRARFEPGSAPLEARWRLLAEGRRRGLGTGVMAMPVLPGISDQPEAIERLVRRARELAVDFVCLGGLTLRPGAQKETYLAAIGEHYPQHLEGYRRTYAGERPSGAADSRYYRRLDDRFRDALQRHAMPGRPPRRLFSRLVPCYIEAALLLEHQEHAHTLAGERRARLDAAGMGIQRWARQRLATNRRRSYDWRSVEQEFRAAVEDRSILTWPEMTPTALSSVEEMLATSPVS